MMFKFLNTGTNLFLTPYYIPLASLSFKAASIIMSVDIIFEYKIIAVNDLELVTHALTGNPWTRTAALINFACKR